MSECKKAKSLGVEIRRRKLEVLEKGEITDFSFLVGNEEGLREVMHCFKSDLMLASDYFAALLRNTPDKKVPVRMKHVQPHIFRRILRFISLQDLEEVENAEDAVSLALAADEFLMELLVPFCASQLQKTVTVDNVWQILNDHPNIPTIRSACFKFLQSETRACLAHPSFLKASKESLVFLLELDFLNVDSENELLEACLKLENTLQSAEAKANLMKAALPHLRLLTLKTKDLTPDILKYLDEPQQLFLLGKLTSVKVGAAAPENFNLNCSPRRSLTTEVPDGQRVLQIISNKMVLSEAVRMATGPFIRCKTFGAIFCPTVDVSISGFEILTPADETPIFGLKTSKDGTKRVVSKNEKIGFCVRINVFYESDDLKSIYSEIFTLSTVSFSSSIYLKMEKELCFPKGVRFQLRFNLSPLPLPKIHRNLPPECYQPPFMDFKFIEITQEQAEIVTANPQKEKNFVETSFFHKEIANCGREVAGNGCFIKSVHYKIL